MKSRFLIFTLFTALMCLGSASNALAQSATGTGVFTQDGGGAPVTVTVSAQQGGNGGVLRLGQPQSEPQGEIIAHPVDMCVQGNTAFVVGEITHASGNFAGTEGNFLVFGFVDNGKDGDAVLVSFAGFIFPDHGSACELFGFPFFIQAPIDRGSFQVKQ